jgi:hypothetical protein
MTDQKSRDPPTLKSDLSLRVDVDPTKVDEKLPPGSVNSTENAAIALDATVTPSASTLIDIYDSGEIDPVYHAKSHAISCVIQDIGMGRYQVFGPYVTRSRECVLLKRVRGSVSSGGCLSLLVLGGSGKSFTKGRYRI